MKGPCESCFCHEILIYEGSIRSLCDKKPEHFSLHRCFKRKFPSRYGNGSADSTYDIKVKITNTGLATHEYWARVSSKSQAWSSCMCEDVNIWTESTQFSFEVRITTLKGGTVWHVDVTWWTLWWRSCNQATEMTVHQGVTHVLSCVHAYVRTFLATDCMSGFLFVSKVEVWWEEREGMQAVRITTLKGGTVWHVDVTWWTLWWRSCNQATEMTVHQGVTHVLSCVHAYVRTFLATDCMSGFLFVSKVEVWWEEREGMQATKCKHRVTVTQLLPWWGCNQWCGEAGFAGKSFQVLPLTHRFPQWFV